MKINKFEGKSFSACRAILSIQAAYNLLSHAKESGRIALYIETTGDDPISDEIEHIWISTSPIKPAARIKTRSPKMRLFDAFIKGILVNKDIEKIVFDGAKACSFLSNNGIKINGKIFDIKVAHNDLEEGSGDQAPESIDSIVEHYLNSDYDDLTEYVLRFRCEKERRNNWIAGNLKAMHLLREKQYNELVDRKLLDSTETEFERIRTSSQINELDRNSYFDKKRWENIQFPWVLEMLYG